MKEIKYINICPKCYSSNYYISNDIGLITGQNGMYVCNNCGFRGTIFPQIDPDNIPKLKKTSPAKHTSKKIKLEPGRLNKINLVKVFVVILLITLTYTAYRFALFDFVKSSHKHAVSFFSKYVHFK